MDPSSGERLPIGADIQPTPKWLASPNDHDREGAGSDHRGGPEAWGKTGNDPSGFKAWDFVSQIFVVPKKDGSHHPVVNVKPLNCHIRKQKFKMEGAKLIRDLLQENDWMVCIDLKDAYLSVPIAQEHRGTTQVCMGRPTVRIPVSSIWAQQCPPNIHEAPQVNHVPFEAEGYTRYTVHDFSGRHAHNGTITKGVERADTRSTATLAIAGFQNHLWKVSAQAKTNHPIPRLHNELCLHGNLSSRRQSESLSSGLFKGHPPREIVCSGTLHADRQDDSHDHGNIASPIVLQESVP